MTTISSLNSIQDPFPFDEEYRVRAELSDIFGQFFRKTCRKFRHFPGKHSPFYRGANAARAEQSQRKRERKNYTFDVGSAREDFLPLEHLKRKFVRFYC